MTVMDQKLMILKRHVVLDQRYTPVIFHDFPNPLSEACALTLDETRGETTRDSSSTLANVQSRNPPNTTHPTLLILQTEHNGITASHEFIPLVANDAKLPEGPGRSVLPILKTHSKTTKRVKVIHPHPFMKDGPVGHTSMTAQDTKDKDTKPQIPKTIRAANESDSAVLKFTKSPESSKNPRNSPADGSFAALLPSSTAVGTSNINGHNQNAFRGSCFCDSKTSIGRAET
ncbi:uncharacterized protein MELLADRAFT_113684 [Melampsora larici-populina 98AG31]|uniref:Uncharacterized protein n=1 Tax=Melampsora larici-populina (strain 98AG31 / pathotype 3-4-7) TaxID=747676 RepID=F4SAR3_MELLP|nr:uncharacterized protein MELLADRAFT_113684 [Melampsora larici-populina 98AG31]EGF98261.1 hypothetical protein MELLADRAFT_113684 [Melampsora larici-populina 98AG31]